MNSRELKNAVYSSIADVTKAFGNANRLEILDLLSNGEKSVEEVASQTAISFANASRHLQMLKSARLVQLRREGNRVFYRLAHPRVAQAWKALKDLSELVEPSIGLSLQEFRRRYQTEQGIRLADIDHANYFLLDVRPADEFLQGHLKGAFSIPVDELPSRMAELPKEKIIVAYCRGNYCTMADAAVQLLRSNGFKALRLEEGVLASLPIQSA